MKIENGVLTQVEKKDIKDGVLNIPGKVTTINSDAIPHDLKLYIKKVIIESGCTKIKRDAFINCRNLNQIQLPNSITSIESLAFYNCESLTEICLPEHITFIGECIFDCCNKLKTISVPSSITTVFQSQIDFDAEYNPTENIVVRTNNPEDFERVKKFFKSLSERLNIMTQADYDQQYQSTHSITKTHDQPVPALYGCNPAGDFTPVLYETDETLESNIQINTDETRRSNTQIETSASKQPSYLLNKPNPAPILLGTLAVGVLSLTAVAAIGGFVLGGPILAAAAAIVAATSLTLIGIAGTGIGFGLAHFWSKSQSLPPNKDTSHACFKPYN
jgi:hypothetical protein